MTPQRNLSGERLWIMIFIALIGASCAQPTMQPTQRTSQPTIHLTNTSTSQPTNTSTKTPSPTITISSTPTPTLSLIVLRIAEIEYDSENAYLHIWAACWSDDSGTIYYAIAKARPPYENLEWIAYNIASGTEMRLDNAPVCYRFTMHASPSGRYVLEETVNQPPADPERPHSGTFDIWLTNTTNQQSAKILEDVLGLGMTQWSLDENIGTLSLASHGASPIYIIYPHTSTVVPLSEITKDHDGYVGGDMILSPDGLTIATPSQVGLYSPLLISLEDGSSELIHEHGWCYCYSWSLDSRMLFYWLGATSSPEEVDNRLQAFDTFTRTSSTLINQITLEENGFRLAGCNYAVSLDGDKIAFWWSDFTEYLWIVILP